MIVRKHQAIAPFWLETLAPAEAERTRAGLTEKTYPPGSDVWHRGDRVEAWTGVVAGLVKISAISSDGKAMTFAGVGAGGCNCVKLRHKKFGHYAVAIYSKRGSGDWELLAISKDSRLPSRARTPSAPSFQPASSRSAFALAGSNAWPEAKSAHALGEPSG